MKALNLMIKKPQTPSTDVDKKGREPDLIATGDRLQALAIKAGYRKQADLARRTGIPAGTLNSYCNGYRRMSYANAARLARVLGTTVDYLFTGKNPSTLIGDTKASQGLIDTQPVLKIRLFSLRDVPYFRMVKNKTTFHWEKMTTLDRPELILGQAYAHLSDRKDERLEPFMVEMDGDKSMEPKVQRDSRVLIDPVDDCQPGKTVLAIFESLGIAVIRTLVMERGSDKKPKKIMRAMDGVNPDLELNEDAGDWCWPVGLIITPP